MGSIFNIDNGFFQVVNKIVDMVILSILWCIVCIPIITIGPATTALYYTVVKVIRRERGYIAREFFRSFKANFKVGSITGIVLTLFIYILFWDRNIVSNWNDTKGFALLCLFNAFLFLIFCVTVYIFPLLSRFNLQFKSLLKTALVIAMRHLPTTLVVLVIDVFFILLTYVAPILLFITPSLCCLLGSLLLERVFKKYMPEKSESSDYNGKDEWYLE